MTAPIAAIDTETTGLDPVFDQIWEFAAIRREPDGTESTLHLFLDHDVERCRQLPESFRRDHERRFAVGRAAVTPRKGAALIDEFLRPGRPHLIGAVPSFDTERLGLLCRSHLGAKWTPPWHYHLCDSENLAVGWLRGRYPEVSQDPPWDSDDLARALGLEIDEEGRHTAMGDARFALAIYDRVMGRP